MKIVYMGTPDFAVPALKKLHENSYEICLVVTKPDRPKDRGKKMQSCEVKQLAEELGLPVETPEKLKGNTEFFEKLKALAPDFIIVAAYGKILPKDILDIPKYGCINIHGSLLPKYRGAAPIHHAVINGEKETGATIMYMAEGMDTGDIISQFSTPVGEKTTEELFDEIAEKGADLLIETLPKLVRGEITPVKQDDSLACNSPMLFKEDGIIDFTKTKRQVACLIRGFSSWPCASTKLDGEVMKVYMAKEGSDSVKAAPGTVVSAGKDGIEVACGDGTVFLTKIQMPGKKAMDSSAFLLGHSIEKGTVLG